MEDVDQGYLHHVVPGAAAAQKVTDHFQGIADLDEQSGNLAVFEGPGDVTTDLVLIAPDGARRAAFPGVSNRLFGGGFLGSAAALFARDGVVYLDEVPPAGVGGTLHVWRDGTDQVIARRVGGFRPARDPDRVYFTVMAESPDGPWDSDGIFAWPEPLPEALRR